MSSPPPSVLEDRLPSPTLTVNSSLILLELRVAVTLISVRASASYPDGFTTFLSHPSAEDDTEYVMLQKYSHRQGRISKLI